MILLVIYFLGLIVCATTWMVHVRLNGARPQDGMEVAVPISIVWPVTLPGMAILWLVWYGSEIIARLCEKWRDKE